MRPAPESVRFGAEERRLNLERMAEDSFDLLVIGGGITGASVAYDASLRGFRVALVEKGDYASGTSSRSSKLIHGGLRYLENFDFALVFEALRERQILFRTAPHLLEAQIFLVPNYEGDRTGPFKLRVGLNLYDLLAGFRSIGRHKILEPEDAITIEPALRRSDLRSLASYYDASTNDSRLTLAVIGSAAAAGARAVNYARVLDLKSDEDGSVTGAVVRDELSGSELEIRAHVTVNACGVWAGAILDMAGASSSKAIRPSKGSHLVLERERLPVRNSIIFESPIDGRAMFVIPWGGFTLVGTTEVETEESPDQVQASPEETAYLLDSTAKLFPNAVIEPDDVCATYAGLRPLAVEKGADEEGAGKVSREHAIIEGPKNLFSVFGGKLTTYRLMGEQVVDLAAARLLHEFGVGARDRCRTKETPLIGAMEQADLDKVVAEAREAASKLGLSEETGAHLVRRYGTQFRRVLGRIVADRRLSELLAPPYPYTAAEAVYAAETEMAQTLTDFMARRTHLIYAGGAENWDVAERAAHAMAPVLDWDDGELQRQLDDYTAERERRRAPLTQLR